uniref:Uncharacterized protein n=1 Tax=Rhizobium leguminosarum TaxID=384 RepID=A0A179BGS2_RHILE|nr:hypothetical protein A4U53_28700 [Rhizobium leguminosarum]
MSIGDDGELAVHRAMIEREEALRLAVAHHIVAVWIAAGDLGLFTSGRRSLSFKGFWPCSLRSASIAASRSAQ